MSSVPDRRAANHPLAADQYTNTVVLKPLLRYRHLTDFPVGLKRFLVSVLVLHLPTHYLETNRFVANGCGDGVGRIPTRKPAGVLQQNQTATDLGEVVPAYILEDERLHLD
jgi:hypothetical protein